jgi:uncharacterized membrane protein YraQ (UPF0718 family)
MSFLSWVSSILKATWDLTAEMAPYLWLGFALAGLLHVFWPVETVTRHLGGNSKRAVLKASILGIPLPLCSCGVLPVAAQLRRTGGGGPPPPPRQKRHLPKQKFKFRRVLVRRCERDPAANCI